MRRVAAYLLIAHLAYAAGAGERLFSIHCAPCHGPKGEGGKGPSLAVSKLPRAADDEALAKVIVSGIPGTEMPGTRMTAGERTELVAYIRALGRTETSQPPGDVGHGERIFWSKGNCGQCHTVGARGGRLGPDLSEIGIRRGPDHLRQSLLDPEADVPENFAVYRRTIPVPDNFLIVRLTLRDGTSISGVRVNEDAFTIQIRDAEDRFHSYRKDELREVHKDWGKSPMPGYRGVLSEEELRDVVAYLCSLRGTP